METTVKIPQSEVKPEVKTNPNKRLLKSYVDYFSEEQCGIILEMIDVVQNGFFYRGNSPHGIDDDIMKRLGYKTFDTAKPQPYMDRLREMGVPNEMLHHTVYDYTTNNWGQLSNYLSRYFAWLQDKLY